MAETRPGNHDRGWNDPPVFLHTGNASAENKTPKKNLLNKRVAYPVCSPGGASQSPGAASYNAATPPVGRAGLPPTLPLVAPPGQGALGASPMPLKPMVPTPQGTPQETAASTNVDDGQAMLETISQKLDEIVVLLKARVQDDVKKRLKIFEEFWTSGKISHHVKLKMLALTEALENRNCDEAHRIHLGLMLDYTNEVGQWMVGIKKLIFETRSLPKSTAQEPNDEHAEGSPSRSNPKTLRSNPESSELESDNLEHNTDGSGANVYTAASGVDALTLNSDPVPSNPESVSSAAKEDENPEDEISDSDLVEDDLPECDRVGGYTSGEVAESNIERS